MEPLIVPRGARARNAKVGAAFGILTGIVVAAGFLVPAPTGTTEEQLTNFTANLRTWEVVGLLDVVILLVAIPFAAYLRSVLEGRSPGTASAAAILFILGIVFGAGASVLQVIEMNNLSGIYTSTTGSAADRAAAVVAAKIFTDISTSLLSLVLLEAGIVLFSVTMLNSRLFSNWVADVGVASAIVFVLILALTVTPVVNTSSALGFGLYLAFLALLLVWVFGSAAYLYRSARPVTLGAAAPA